MRVWIVRPLFGTKTCEKIGGKDPNSLVERGVQDFNLGYVRYGGTAWGWNLRVRWEAALYVMGEREAEDCTDRVSRHGLTRLK